MPVAQEMRDSSGLPLVGRYRRVSTEGDALRFIQAEPGRETIIHLTDFSAAISGLPLIREYELPFHYQQGAKQLEVSIVTTDGMLVPLNRLATVTEARENVTLPWPVAGDLDPADAGWRGFAERTSNTIWLYNVDTSLAFHGSAAVGVQARIPHTSTPGSNRSRLTIENQPDNEAVEMLGRNDGMVFVASDGGRWLLRIGPNGNIVTERR